jgi:RNA polymerase sigma-70 factor (ECF subfamily)
MPEAALPSDAASDDTLVCRVARGDREAWQQLVERHLGKIVAHGWHMLGERAEAEDVAQEVFLRLHAKCRDWRADGPPLRAWLHRVASNLCIDQHRRRRFGALDEASEVSDPTASPAALADRSDRVRALQGALAGLPPRQRLALVLVHYQGFSGREAADLMEISVDALESLLARARRAVRQTLSPIAADLLTEEISDG